MRSCAIILFLSLSILGCSGRPQPKKQAVLAKINNYEIGRQEFENEFRASSYGRIDTLLSRQEFLKALIDRKLILQDAEVKSLDKAGAFLKMIEKFWEQSLVKLALDKKSKELSGSGIVSDKTIKDAYDKLSAEGRADRPYDQMYQQIKWEIIKLKEAQAMNDWLLELHNKSDIKVNYELLKEGK